MIDLKNEAHGVYETTKRQLEEFRSKIPTDVAEQIEKALNELNEVKDKDLQPNDVDTIKKAIEDTRNAAMKIGQSMSQGGSSSSSESTSSESQGEKKEEDKEKKD